MKIKVNNFLLTLFFFLIYFVYHQIFSFSPIQGGDYISYSQSVLNYWKNYAFSAWDPKVTLGSSAVGILNYGWYAWLIGWTGSIINYNIVFIERIFWWLSFIVLSLSFPILISYKVTKSKYFSFLSGLIFLFNTYILMVIGGGQISGIGMAYAISALVIFQMLRVKNKLKNSIVLGLLLTLLFIFDIRIWYIILSAIGAFALFDLIYSKVFSIQEILRKIFFILFLPIAIVVLLHAQWFLPMLILRQNPLQSLGSAYSTASAVKFFSFATFENTLGLVHPNWPENVFGLIHFMRPEFLLLPILAFGSLLFIKRGQKENKYVLYFGLLGLFGVFLAKGANEPFGEIYLWMFGHVPGFEMFRDPTKWYLLIAISYSVLIPFTIEQVYIWLKEQKKFSISPYIFLFLVVCYLLFLIRPAFLGQLTGTFKYHPIPWEYKKLNSFLENDHKFYRTLWIPTSQRFAEFSITHPVVSAEDLFHTDQKGVLNVLKNTINAKLIVNSSIQYIVIPFDSEKEIFVKDRKYSNNLYNLTITQIRKLNWLKEIGDYGRIHVFKIQNSKDHFWISNDSDAKVKYIFISPTEYSMNLNNVHKGDRLVFTDLYDSHWQLTEGGKEFHSSAFANKLNSFTLPDNGNYKATIYYTPQTFVNIGLIISIVSLIIVLVIFIVIR